ncbi:MAG: O-antigen ligase family protein, partial [Cyclobacteriaceae bacterium]
YKRQVLDFGDLSVIQEQTIKDPHDSRLNGFTLRIILWQESLNISNAKELIFGRGVSLSGNKSLERSLERRGLTDHLWYNAHNQYITTMYEMGLIGFILLMALLVYTIRLAVSTKDRVLLAFTLLMSIAMLSESILKRASGIAFFCMVILLLSNTRMSESKKS